MPRSHPKRPGARFVRYASSQEQHGLGRTGLVYASPGHPMYGVYYVDPRYSAGLGYLVYPAHSTGSGYLAYPAHSTGSGYLAYPAHSTGSGYSAYPEHSTGSGYSAYPEHSTGSGYSAYPEHSTGSGYSAYPMPSPYSNSPTYPAYLTNSIHSVDFNPIDCVEVVSVDNDSKEEKTQPRLTQTPRFHSRAHLFFSTSMPTVTDEVKSEEEAQYFLPHFFRPSSKGYLSGDVLFSPAKDLSEAGGGGRFEEPIKEKQSPKRLR